MLYCMLGIYVIIISIKIFVNVMINLLVLVYCEINYYFDGC